MDESKTGSCQEQRTVGREPSPEEKRQRWDERAEEFSRHAASTGYSERFLALMDIRPDWTVFDMACGGGTLAIPLAKRVKAVTAVDFSANMLDVVRYRCKEEGITNIRTIQARWEDDWTSLGIGPHDVAIASRSLMGDDPRPCIEKLNNMATKQVYISVVSGDGPSDRRLLKAVGKEVAGGHDYIYYYNLLYEMGIRANVAFIHEDHTHTWNSHAEAFEDQKWMFRGMTAEEEEKVRAYLKEHLILKDGRWRLPYERRCGWAVMWWGKEQNCCS